MADVFISYSRADYDDFVKAFVDDLRAENIDVWIDQKEIRAGTNWEQALRDAIRDSRAVLLIATVKSRESNHVADEIAIAHMENKPVYPIWAKGEDGRYLDCIRMGYGSTQYVDARGANYGRALREIIQGIRGEKTIPTLTIAANFILSEEIAYPPQIILHEPPIRPYKGLESFKEADKDIFFGREVLSETLVAKIQTIAATDSRLLAVVGASGSGKSSVIMAGMIPLLRKQVDWLILDPMTPGAKPLRTLALILASHLSRPLTSILDDLRHPMAEGLDLIAREIGNKKRVLLYIDQFEEIFTLADESERQQFINLLVTAAMESSGPLSVILSLRADFYDRPSNYRELGELINRNNELILPMSLSELVDAVERPAALAILRFESGLVSEIVFALREKSGALAGALPLLQFALERLYDERDGDKLTRTAYEKIGRIEGAIGNHAEEVFKTLDEPAQNALGDVFRALVNPGDPPTRKRAKLADVIADEPSKNLVDALIKARLLITGLEEDETVYIEVAHEALLRTWTRLAVWIASVADDLRLLNEVENAARMWEDADRPNNYLWWKHEQLAPVYVMIERLNPPLDEVIEAFLKPEAERLLEEFASRATKDYRKSSIIDRWIQIGEPAIRTMVEALRYANPYLASSQVDPLIYALRPYTDIALPTIITMLHEDSGYARPNAARALSLLGDAQTIPALLVSLSDEDKTVRQNIARALGEIGDHRAIPKLLDALSDEDWDVRGTVVETLNKILDPQAIQTFLAALQDSNIMIAVSDTESSSVRAYAAEALGKIADPQAVPILSGLLADTIKPIYSEGRVCDLAASALKTIDTQEAQVALANWQAEHPDNYAKWREWKQKQENAS